MGSKLVVLLVLEWRIEKWFELCHLAANQGNTDAQYTLGQHNEYRGSKEEANKRFLSAVNQDNPLALTNYTVLKDGEIHLIFIYQAIKIF